MARLGVSPWLSIVVLYAFGVSVASAVSGQEPLKAEKAAYTQGQAIPVTCLNRTIETGEHITDASGQLQYIPFFTCNETGRPLELFFGVEKEVNCTLDFISDSQFHLFEYYIHSDAPLTCRIPSLPLPGSTSSGGSTSGSNTFSEQTGAMGTTDHTNYTPLILALAGTLQLSHLHVSNHLNLLLHTSLTNPNTIDAGIAYSVSTSDPAHSTRIKIGDSLTLHFSVRWFPSPSLPQLETWARGMGGHVYFSTLLYCLLSAGGAAAICIAYFRGVDLPKRLKGYVKDREGRIGNGAPYTGYGYSGSVAPANGYAYSSGGGGGGGYGGYGYRPGKKD